MFFQKRQYENITPEELREKRERAEGFFLLDVRTAGEFAEGAIEGARLIPVQELGHRVAELPRDREIVVYCRVGNRSAFAAAHLAHLGFNVTNLEGGILAWSLAQENAFAVAS